MRLHTTTTLLTLLATAKIILCQLESCVDVGCPFEQFAANCSIGDTTAKAIGVSNFTSTLTTQPLAWTIAISRTDDPNSRSKDLWRKDFYLGYPQTLDLQTESNLTGCALFFEGISPKLEFHTDRSTGTVYVDNGRCADALGYKCVDDWLAQAKSTMSELRGSSNQSANICSTLADRLRDNPPDSCTAPWNGTWGDTDAKKLTGLQSPAPIELSDCHPTINPTYSLSRFANYSASLHASATEQYPFVGGITPVMTILMSTTSPANESEVDLSCMKVMDILPEPTGIGARGSSIRNHPSLLLSILTSVMAILVATCFA